MNVAAWSVERRRACERVLAGVLVRLGDEKRHTVKALARDASGLPVPPRSPSANCWCVVGAIFVESGRLSLAGDDAVDVLHDEVSSAGAPGLAAANDGHNGHARILASIEHAIARLRRAS